MTMPATTTCFSSNLGAKALECNPQDVTGTQRYKFFATALTGSGHKETLLTLSDNINQTTKTSPQSQSKAQKQQKSTERSNNNLPPPIFQESSTQTNDVKVLPSLPSLSSFSSNENNEPNKEQQLMAEIQLEKIAREKERKEQEAALPPVTDKQSLEAYRIFLEENEKKDFALREKELDEMMKLKLKSIEENLYERYMNSSLLNQEKVELIRNNKLQSLKKKGNVLSEHDIYKTNRQEKFIDSFDIGTTTMKFNNRRVIKGQSHSRNRRTKEDLELILAYFENNT